MDESAAQKRFAGLAMFNLVPCHWCHDFQSWKNSLTNGEMARKSILRTRLNQNGVGFGAKIDSQNKAESKKGDNNH